MRSIEKPSHEVSDVYKLCISRVNDTDFKERLERCEGLVMAASIEFEKYAKRNTFHELKSDTTLRGLVTPTEMVSVYTDRMAKKSSPGRSVYDAIMMLPKNGKCPFCGHRMVSTLDHYMPKAKFPILSVVPLNLVASCKDCNFEKRALEPTNSSDAPLHPYFDTIDDVTWLRAEVLESKPPAIEFSITRPDHWPEDLHTRVKNHFECLELHILYGLNAAEEISNIAYHLEMINLASGKSAVQSSLRDMARSRMRVDMNSWQSALYVALSESDWFCDGGFLP
ncbi:MAG: hypothetical protein RLP14_08225 [Owenweeksia sp.]